MYGINNTEMKIHIEIKPEVKKEINILRNEKGLSLNWLVNRAIQNYLKLRKQSTTNEQKNKQSN